jgi:hypothetical protein
MGPLLHAALQHPHSGTPALSHSCSPLLRYSALHTAPSTAPPDRNHRTPDSLYHSSTPGTVRVCVPRKRTKKLSRTNGVHPAFALEHGRGGTVAQERKMVMMAESEQPVSVTLAHSTSVRQRQNTTLFSSGGYLLSLFISVCIFCRKVAWL